MILQLNVSEPVEETEHHDRYGGAELFTSWQPGIKAEGAEVKYILSGHATSKLLPPN